MLYLFGGGATGEDICNLDIAEFNIEKIREYSIAQGIWTVVYPELSKRCDIALYSKEFFLGVTRSIQRLNFTLNIISELICNGIKCCLIKGNIIAMLYHSPECRISSDVDILINPYDEPKVKDFLTHSGYQIEKREKNW